MSLDYGFGTMTATTLDYGLGTMTATTCKHFCSKKCRNQSLTLTLLINLGNLLGVHTSQQNLLPYIKGCDIA